MVFIAMEFETVEFLSWNFGVVVLDEFEASSL